MQRWEQPEKATESSRQGSKQDLLKGQGLVADLLKTQGTGKYVVQEKSGGRDKQVHRDKGGESWL